MSYYNIISIFEGIDWFSECNHHNIINLKYSYEYVDKVKVIDSLNGIKWSNISTHEFNTLFEWYKKSGVFLNWNRTVNDLKRKIIPIIIDDVKLILKEEFGKNTQLVHNYFSFDILMIMMKEIIVQNGYFDNVPIFYGELLKVYKSGHFPCGWRNKYPKGNLLLY